MPSQSPRDDYPQRRELGTICPEYGQGYTRIHQYISLPPIAKIGCYLSESNFLRWREVCIITFHGFRSCRALSQCGAHVRCRPRLPCREKGKVGRCGVR